MKILRAVFMATFLVVAVIGQVDAFNGFTVYLKDTEIGIGGWGAMHCELWRADIVKSAVTTRTQLSAGPAMYPSISPDGQWIAFVRQTSGTAGRLCVMPAAGGTVTELTNVNSECAIDFPSANWIYFTRGRVDSEESRYILRIARTGGTVQAVDTLDWGCCQFLISNDLTRATIRTANNVLADHAMLLHYDMVNHTGRVITQGCAVGMSSDGIYSMVSWQDHWGYDIRNWATGAVIQSFTDSAMFMWPPNSATNTRYTQHNYWISGFATNSPKWMCIALDNNTSPFYLVNWQDKQCINVTAGLTGVFAAGDLWVGDTSAPSLKLSTDTVSLECPLGGPAPATQGVQVTNGHNTGTLAGVTTSIQYLNGSNWLMIARTISGAVQTLTHTVSPTGLPGATYKAVVTVTDANADPATTKYTVKFKVVVPRFFTRIDLLPASDTILTSSVRQFAATATDQYQEVYANPPLVYTVPVGQLIDTATGLFQAGAIQGGPYNVIVSATIDGVTKRDTSRVFVKLATTFVSTMLSLRSEALIQGPSSLRVPGTNISNLQNVSLLGIPDSAVQPTAGDTARVGGFLYTWAKVNNDLGVWATDPHNGDCVSYYSLNAVSPVAQNVRAVNAGGVVRMWINGKYYYN